MRRSDVTTVRRSVVGTHVRTVRRLAVRFHVGMVIRSVLVKAVAFGRLIADWSHLGSGLRSLLRLHLRSGLRSLLGLHLRFYLRSLLRLHLRFGLWSLLRFHLRSGLRSLLRFHLFGHGAYFGTLFYLCGSGGLRFVRAHLRCFVRASLRWSLFLHLCRLFRCAAFVAAAMRCGISVACEGCRGDEHGDECTCE